MDKFLEGVAMRHACKVFDENKQIPKEQFDNILQVGYAAPSSFGMEPTRLIVLRDKKARQEVRALCWDQKQITTASELVIFKTLKTDLLAHTNYVQQALQRKQKTPEEIAAYKERYGSYLIARGYDDYKIGYWSALQSYIIATSMMDYASYLGIDTCMLEGFDKKALESYFGLDKEKEQITLLLAFGYRINPQSKRYRIDFDEFVQYK
ncbi:NAD(P)H-dependent oxidoreductase [Helicobacter sp. TUL]|uniref:NAD(P)H-dependent oxidoreductase n=1 Tax=Helicobacter sp. TUL TaxID=1848928 RepID=UPI000BABAF34|nr:NAD(P)H-dependent oxidoreductase [Helicobacter sp. TUL]PAU99940.1 NAD(P)H-dependent oxidoreductase [Helicobacter sp. TUL]